MSLALCFACAFKVRLFQLCVAWHNDCNNHSYFLPQPQPHFPRPSLPQAHVPRQHPDHPDPDNPDNKLVRYLVPTL